MTIISDVGHPGLGVQPAQEAGNVRRNAKANTHPDEAVAGASASATAAGESADATAHKAQGVLRLLQEGHFQGVADARLRINFSEEIAALQDSATLNTAETGSAELVARAEAAISAFLDVNTLDEEATQEILAAHDALDIAVEAAREALAETNPPDIFQFINDLQSAADEFLATLADILDIVPIAAADTSSEGGTDTEADSAAVPADAATASPVSPFEEFVSSLIDTLNAVITDLDEALQNISVLPPLSEPKGNGVAFDKFAAALTHVAAPAETGDSSEALDIIA